MMMMPQIKNNFMTSFFLLRLQFYAKKRLKIRSFLAQFQFLKFKTNFSVKQKVLVNQKKNHILVWVDRIYVICISYGSDPFGLYLIISLTT